MAAHICAHVHTFSPAVQQISIAAHILYIKRHEHIIELKVVHYLENKTMTIVTQPHS